MKFYLTIYTTFLVVWGRQHKINQSCSLARNRRRLSLSRWALPARKRTDDRWWAPSMLLSESDDEDKPSSMKGSRVSWLVVSRSGFSPSSHCIANAWSPIQLEIQYVANLCDFSFEMSMRRCFSEGNRPLRNPMACSDRMRTMETWLLKTSLSGKSRSGFLYGATTQTLIYIHLSNNN